MTKMKNTQVSHQRFNFDEEDESQIQQRLLPYTVQSKVQNIFRFKIDEFFDEPRYYRNVTDICLQAQEDDQIHFHLNSGGGSVSALNTCLDAISRTDAITVAVIQGDCHSAASILALHCDFVDVGLYATMLCHHASYPIPFQKAADVESMVQHYSENLRDLMQETYEGFMTPSEIQEMLDGKQFYMNSKEIVARLEARDEYFDAQVQALAEEAAVEASKPVSKPTKKTTKQKE